jgi:hypothetical protein
MHCGYEEISSALDRHREAHFWLHMMEDHYHSADQFRWHLNVFMKALKEVPDMVSMALQNKPGFPEWFHAQKASLKSDPLMQALSKRRDQVVHREMLVPKSHAEIGVTEGRGMKLGMGFPVDPLDDSDVCMERYLLSVKKAGANKMADFLGILVPDEDSMPCVRREWRLAEFDEELVDLCARAWLRTGETLMATLRWLGEDPPSQALSCRSSHQAVLFKTYDRNALIKRHADLPMPDEPKPSAVR